MTPEESRDAAYARAEATYQDPYSQNYRDNGRYKWAISVIKTGYEQEKNKVPDCNKCQVPMKTGLALKDVTALSIPEYEGQPQTIVEVTGRSKMVACWKCPQCGKSITK